MNDHDQERWKSSWPLGAYDCFYFRYKNQCQCFPFFIPMSVCGTCCILGRIRSKLVQEDVCCLGMGEQGCCLCALSAPLTMCGPFGGFCWFAWTIWTMRRQVVETYNIDDIYVNNKNSCCCCPSLITILYPCSAFQIYMTLLLFEQSTDDFDSPLVSTFQ